MTRTTAARKLLNAELRARTAANGGVAPVAKHGTNAYTNWGCRCAVCVAAQLAASTEYRAKRYARTAANGGVAPVANHGHSTYNIWGCRCDVCRQSVLAAQRNYRRRKRGGRGE